MPPGGTGGSMANAITKSVDTNSHSQVQFPPLRYLDNSVKLDACSWIYALFYLGSQKFV